MGTPQRRKDAISAIRNRLVEILKKEPMLSMTQLKNRTGATRDDIIWATKKTGIKLPLEQTPWY